MSNPWFRFYAEFLHDPKVRVMSETDQLRLVLLFCLRCSNDKPLKDEHIAFSLRINVDEWKQTKSVFIECGFLTIKNDLTNWDKRQFLSDSSVDRVKKYRNNRKDLGLSCNGYTKHSVTVMSRDGNCCVYCGSQNNLCIDHILPTQQGGNDDIGNLATACKACNSGKSGRTPEQARYSFMNKQTESIWLAWMLQRVTVTVTPPEQNRTDTEHKKPLLASTSEFDRFWEAWPKSKRKGGRTACVKFWKDKKLDSVSVQIISHVEYCKGNGVWRDEQFIEAPVVYLRAFKWDGAETASAGNSNGNESFLRRIGAIPS